MVLLVKGRLVRAEIVMFFVNCKVNEGRVTSEVMRVMISSDNKELGDILNISDIVYSDYTKLKWPCLDDLPTSLEITRKFSDEEKEKQPRSIYKSEMNPFHKVLFEFVNKVVLSKQERRHRENFMDRVLKKLLDKGKQINCLCFMI